MTAALIPDLTDAEAGALVEAERTIERGLKTFVEVGQALARIRDERLYRTEYSAFGDYCRDRWSIGRDYAERLITAAEVVPTIVGNGLPAPKNEAQARELARVSEADRPDVWREARERSGGRPTAATVREVARERQAPPPATVTGSDGKQYPARLSTQAGQHLPPQPTTTEAPERQKPPAWDPEERRQHEEEVRRIQDIEAARRTAKTIVTTIRSEVVTIVAGCRLGERGLVTVQMIADLRASIDLLEGEIDREE